MQRIAFAGEPLRIPVGPGWLGPICTGRGEPADGGPPVLGTTTTAAVAGHPLNPVWREPPAEPVLIGVSAIDALTTLARGQKLPIFATPGLPHLELATQIAAQATSAANRSPWCSPEWASPTPTPRSSGTRWSSVPPQASWCCCSTPRATR